MKLGKCIAGLVCFILPLALIAGEPGKLREIDAKDLKVDFEKGKVKMPRVITSVEELDKAIPGAEKVKKAVDFTKDKLVLFAWGGSGGDKLAPKLSDDGKTVTFHYTAGLTREFRRHVHLYAIPKAAEVKFDK
jgi:hypothetical protein